MNNISFSNYISTKLRANIQDPNSLNRTSQFGNWIYGDRPKILQLLKNINNFPRISIESMTDNTVEDIGMERSDQIESVTLQISVWVCENLICTVESTDAEEITYHAATDIYPMINLPLSAVSLVTGTLATIPNHTFIQGTDYNVIDNDDDGFYDSIEWLGVDEPDDNTSMYVSYQRKASNDELCRYIAKDINTYLRSSWRDWSERIVWGYEKTGGSSIKLDNSIGIYRYELTVKFTGINICEIV